MTELSNLDSMHEQLLELSALDFKKCPNCGSDNNKFLDVSIWSGKYFSKCQDCSWLSSDN